MNSSFSNAAELFETIDELVELGLMEVDVTGEEPWVGLTEAGHAAAKQFFVPGGAA